MPSQPSNVEHNRTLSNDYAKNWSRAKVAVEDPAMAAKTRKARVRHLGDEWGTAADVERIVAEYIYPFVTKKSVVAEIGVGGARIASKVVERVKHLYCFDISSEMLKRAKVALAKYPHVRYVRLGQPRFPRRFVEMFDFVYSFDVFVHLDLHLMWRYFNEIRTMLKAGGKAFIHTTNLKAPEGWRQFSSQTQYSIGGHYFVSPEIVEILAQRSRLSMIKTSTVDPSSFYLSRDYLVVLEKSLGRCAGPRDQRDVARGTKDQLRRGQ